MFAERMPRSERLSEPARRRRRRFEALATIVSCVAVLAAGIAVDAMERLLTFAERHEAWQLDEWFLLFIVLTVAFGVVSRRRTRSLELEIAERHHVEESLRASERRLLSVLELSPNPIFVTSFESGVIMRANGEFARFVGRAMPELIGRTAAQLGLWCSPEDAARVRRRIQGESSLRNVELSLRVAPDDVRTTLFSIEVVELDGVKAILGTLNDITDRKRLEDQLAHQAFHDALTGLANRALFQDRVRHALSRATRAGRPPAVLYLDLDGFKRVNDSHGHAVGDRLLVDVAARVAGCLRSSDTCARLGGDEFAVLIEDAAGVPEVEALAERLLVALRKPVAIDGASLHIGASIGIAMGDGAAAAGELLRNADLAMYLSKSGGKNRYTLFEPSMHAEVVKRLELESEMRDGMDRDEFTLLFQPIVSIAEGRVIGGEALVRWRHPRRGILSAAEFIPIAEETGLIVELGRTILMRACSDWRRLQLQREDDDVLSLAVNLSGKQVLSPTLVDDVVAALEHSGMAPSSLVLEITEGVLVHNDRAVVDRLWALKQLGVQLAVDDFGTGYSSLAYLQRFPVDILKIDKSFTDRLGTAGAESPLSRAVIGLGQTLSIQTIAEGVETEAQWERLRDLGCELGQGYLFARPMAADELLAMLGGAVLAGAGAR